MLNKLTEISLLKEKFINERKKVLSSQVSELQKNLYIRLFDRLIAQLDAAEGKLENTPDNIRKAAIVDKVFKDFETDMERVMKTVVSDYNSLLGYNIKYYSKFNVALFKTVQNRVEKSMLARVGYSSDGFQKDGFIDSFIKDKSVARTVKNTVLSSVLNGAPLKTLQKSLADTITGTQTSSGVLENHFKTYIYDTYSQFDSESGNQFAIQLDLNYAIYAGGLVDASRPFCIERNDKAFTREEVERFGTSKDKFGGYTNKAKGEFAGKNKDYIPERDRGGYNCGHIYNWVSLAIAKSKRPDISVSKYDKK